MELITLELHIDHPILRGIMTKHFENLAEIVRNEEDEIVKAMNKGCSTIGEFKLAAAMTYHNHKQEVKSAISTSIAIKGDATGIFQHPDQTKFKFE